MELQGLHNVYVSCADNTVEIREITVGPKVGSNWLITEGLKPGEKVVYEGLQKVKDGSPPSSPNRCRLCKLNRPEEKVIKHG
jgi:membrane fusion protein (multidrug efflux system)